MIPSSQQAIAETRAWVDRAVIGLNLCPFARAVQARDQIRYVVSEATAVDALLAELRGEMDRLVATDAAEVDTTLLIHPQVLTIFPTTTTFSAWPMNCWEQLGYDGVLQVASFHPQFQFAGTDVNDVTNATNRSPYPTLHLLREDSVDPRGGCVPAGRDDLREKHPHPADAGRRRLHRPAGAVQG